MTFTNYLRDLARRGLGPDFLPWVEHDAWPEDSGRLSDYETFLRSHIARAQVEVIPDLREAWLEWLGEAAGDGCDLALAAWRDYALHLRDCDLGQECSRARHLLTEAIAESQFFDLDGDEPDHVPCEAPGARFLRQVQQVIDQVFGPSAVIPGTLPAAPRRSPPKPPRSKS